MTNEWEVIRLITLQIYQNICVLVRSDSKCWHTACLKLFLSVMDKSTYVMRGRLILTFSMDFSKRKVCLCLSITWLWHIDSRAFNLGIYICFYSCIAEH